MYINQKFQQFMVTLLINDTWKLCFEKSQSCAVFFAASVMLRKTALTLPMIRWLMFVLQFTPPKSNVLSSSSDFHQFS